MLVVQEGEKNHHPSSDSYVFVKLLSTLINSVLFYSILFIFSDCHSDHRLGRPTYSSAAQRHKREVRTIHRYVVHCSVVQYNVVHCNVVQYNVVQYNVVQYNVVQFKV